MKSKIGMALGIGVGQAVYGCIRVGVDKIDWAGAAFIAVFSFLILLFIPARIFAK